MNALIDKGCLGMFVSSILAKSTSLNLCLFDSHVIGVPFVPLVRFAFLSDILLLLPWPARNNQPRKVQVARLCASIFHPLAAKHPRYGKHFRILRVAKLAD